MLENKNALENQLNDIQTLEQRLGKAFRGIDPRFEPSVFGTMDKLTAYFSQFSRQLAQLRKNAHFETVRVGSHHDCTLWTALTKIVFLLQENEKNQFIPFQEIANAFQFEHFSKGRVARAKGIPILLTLLFKNKTSEMELINIQLDWLTYAVKPKPEEFAVRYALLFNEVSNYQKQVEQKLTKEELNKKYMDYVLLEITSKRDFVLTTTCYKNKLNLEKQLASSAIARGEFAQNPCVKTKILELQRYHANPPNLRWILPFKALYPKIIKLNDQSDYFFKNDAFENDSSAEAASFFNTMLGNFLSHLKEFTVLEGKVKGSEPPIVYQTLEEMRACLVHIHSALIKMMKKNGMSARVNKLLSESDQCCQDIYSLLGKRDFSSALFNKYKNLARVTLEIEREYSLFESWIDGYDDYEQYDTPLQKWIESLCNDALHIHILHFTRTSLLGVNILNKLLQYLTEQDEKMTAIERPSECRNFTTYKANKLFLNSLLKRLNALPDSSSLTHFVKSISWFYPEDDTGAKQLLQLIQTLDTIVPLQKKAIETCDVLANQYLALRTRFEKRSEIGRKLYRELDPYSTSPLFWYVRGKKVKARYYWARKLENLLISFHVRGDSLSALSHMRTNPFTKIEPKSLINRFIITILDTERAFVEDFSAELGNQNKQQLAEQAKVIRANPPSGKALETQIRTLYTEVNAMQTLATAMKTSDYATKLIELTANIKTDLDRFVVDHPDFSPDENALDQFKYQFCARLRSRDDLMHHHPKPWLIRLANLLIAVCSLGLAPLYFKRYDIIRTKEQDNVETLSEVTQALRPG
ncbi:MAG: hypothetical protein WC785_05395 [Tatlockia sp.]|jgi:hypothetical protein